MLSKCSDIDREHIDSEGIEVEGGDGDIDLDDGDNNLDNSALHCIDIFDKNVHFGVWGRIGPLGTEHKILSNTIKKMRFDKSFETKKI